MLSLTNKKAKISKTKIMASTIAIILMLSISASLVLLPSATAHTPIWQIPTYAYIVAEPNPVGVGQSINVYMWLDALYGDSGGSGATLGTNGSTSSGALLSNNYRFHDYQLTITPPNGTATTQLFPIIASSDSAQGYTFTPTMVGTYTLNFTYLGQVYGANGNGYSGSPTVNDTYLPSTATTTLTVQQEPIPQPLSGVPMPTQYWTRPIYGQNSDWWSISSNWLGTGSGVISTSGFNTLTGFTAQAYIERYPGDAVGSQTPHIMWTKPIQFGGVVGGNDYSGQGVGYFEGSAYNQRFTNPIVINGYLYYTEPVGFTAPNNGPLKCVDLRTGQVVWSSNSIPALSFGYIYNLWDPDQHGVFPPMLVTSNWAQVFDAFSGTALFNVTGVPGGSATTMGPNGEQLRYVFANAGTASNPQWYLAQWNSSKLWQYDINPYTYSGSTSPSIVNASNGLLITAVPIALTGTSGTLPNGTSYLAPYGSSLIVNGNIPLPASTGGVYQTGAGNASLATYDWNISVPWLNTMPLQQTYNAATGVYSSPLPGTNPVTVYAAFTGNMMLCGNGSLPTGFAASGAGYPQLPYTLFAVNLNQSVGAIGSILWSKTYNPPTGNLTVKFAGADPTTNVFMMSYQESQQYYGFSLTTGEQIWGPTPAQTAFDYYGAPYFIWQPSQIADGKLYDCSFSGILYCYDDTTGKLEWTYGNGGAGNTTKTLSTPYGDYPTFLNAIGNGIIYLVTSEHTITDPIYKGALARAINASTGQEIWTLSDYTGEFSAMSYAIADGFSVFTNGYDNQIYSVGRGSSATTVTAQPAVSAFGDPVVIRGIVTDTSSGTKQTQQAANFPAGVPVASDASMSDWMSYVYQQGAKPTNFTGVQVNLSVIDSNGNQYSIGTATTDETGTYSLTYTPTVPGDYTVLATFAGTNGYWPSNTETTFNIMQSSHPTIAPTPITATLTSSDLMTVAIAIIVVIIIVGAVLAILMLRKH
jgi:hypothetical protein